LKKQTAPEERTFPIYNIGTSRGKQEREERQESIKMFFLYEI